jgi:AspT/YidE/YbjL antiporter-like protein
MVTIFIGIVLGLLLGCIPFAFPGMSYPVRLGLAGGPIVMGILIGAYGPRFHMVAYTTTSANLMLRSLGLSMYLACLGLDAGRDFLNTVMQPTALLWIGFGMLITLVPVIVMSIVSVKWDNKSFATTAGMLCGAMANPIALNYVNEPMPGNRASVAYATVYPLSMFLRVIIAQLIVMLWFA